MTEDEFELLENDEDAKFRLWGALCTAMESHEEGPEKFLQLILDVRDGLVKVTEMIRVLAGSSLEDLVEETLAGESPVLVTDHLD